MWVKEVGVIVYIVFLVIMFKYFYVKNKGLTILDRMIGNSTLIVTYITMGYTFKYIMLNGKLGMLGKVFGSVTAFDFVVGALSIYLTYEIFKIGIELQAREYYIRHSNVAIRNIRDIENLMGDLVLLNKEIDGKGYLDLSNEEIYRYKDVLVGNIKRVIENMNIFLENKDVDESDTDTIHKKEFKDELYEIISSYKKALTRFINTIDMYKEFEGNINGIGTYYVYMYKINNYLIDVLIKYIRGNMSLLNLEYYDFSSIISREYTDIIKKLVGKIMNIKGEGSIDSIEVGLKENKVYLLGGLYAGGTCVILYRGVKNKRENVIDEINNDCKKYNVKLVGMLYIEEGYNYETVVVTYEKL